jgi:hypothetical protein
MELPDRDKERSKKLLKIITLISCSALTAVSWTGLGQTQMTRISVGYSAISGEA